MKAFRLASFGAALALVVAAGFLPAVQSPPVPAATPTARPVPTATPTPLPGEIQVKVTVTAPDRKVVPGAMAVLWIPGSKAPKPPANLKIASKDKRFDPRITAVPQGATVDFPNYDKIFHNAFSLSEKAKFDLGLYRNGASKPVTFSQPGLVKVYCNIHPQMAALVLVVDGELYGLAGPDGTAVLQNLRPGRYAVKVWEERGGEWSGTADVASGKATTLTVALDGSTFKDAPHKNKYGKDYPPPDDDENRY